MKDILCSWIERLNVVKMSIITTEIYRLNEISMAFFTGISNLKIYMKIQGIPIIQNNLEKEEQSWRHRHGYINQ